MVRPIVFWGATGQARVLQEFIGSLGYELVALFDNQAETLSPFPEVPIFYGEVGFRRWRSERGERDVAALVAIGGAHGRDRLQIQRFLEDEGCAPIVAIHPTAFVARTARIGPGGQVLARAAICADATLGASCIVNTAASIDHECALGEAVHVGP